MEEEEGESRLHREPGEPFSGDGNLGFKRVSPCKTPSVGHRSLETFCLPAPPCVCANRHGSPPPLPPPVPSLPPGLPAKGSSPLRARASDVFKCCLARFLMTKLPVYVPVGRRPRNLVLSVCDFKLHQQAGPAGGSFRAGAAPPEASSGPPGRVGCKLIVGRGTQLLLHGGADETGCYGDLHAIELEKAACTELLVGGFSKPTGRYGHSLCAHGEVAILFGGLAEAESATQQLKLDELEWMQPETEGQAPQPRAFHAAAICEDALLIFGGVLDSAFSEARNDLHLLDLNAWRWAEACGEERQRTEEASTEELSANGVSEDLRFILRGASPAPRYGHAMARVPKKNRCIMFGGEEDGGTLWCLDLNFAYHGPRSSNSSNKNLLPGGNVNLLQKVEASWSRIETYRTGPQSRRFHSLALIGAERLVIFGGVAVSKPQDPTGFYVLDLNACRWRRPMYEGSACLSGAGEAVLHDKLILFGGASVTHSIRHLSGSPAPAEAKDASNLPGAYRDICRYADLCTARGSDPPGDASISSNTGVRSSSSITGRLLFLSVLEIKDGMSAEEYRFKLVTVGDSGVGKSCLLLRFVQDEFTDSHVCTIGVDFRSVSTMARGRLCTLQLWDTAGQERFSGVTGNYYRSADGFVLVYDATRRESFEHLNKWVAQIKEHHALGPSTVLLLVGNKADLEEEIAVSEEEGRRFAESLGAFFTLASAKTSANVDSAFLLMASKLAEKRRNAVHAAAAPPGSTADAGTATGESGGRDSAVSLVESPSFAARTHNLCSGCGGLRAPLSSQPRTGAASRRTPADAQERSASGCRQPGNTLAALLPAERLTRLGVQMLPRRCSDLPPPPTHPFPLDAASNARSNASVGGAKLQTQYELISALLRAVTNNTCYPREPLHLKSP
ncbi:uncharacterized protein LOC34624460 [Cyclospora cayetanensis]|uniref:Uncharacterized protein LOC34624460 n=1 Tax=Cyclospora cayetanensis TaxID=88456 RepID=A0A6P6S546_9EIME|nr:uncharacterized protein LOC34624460 [Cyclospora cayetanensis]